MIKAWLGVDVGLSGAMCVLRKKGVSRLLATPIVVNKLTSRTKSGRHKIRNLINIELVWAEILNNVKLPNRRIMAAIEGLSARPFQGVSSSFQLGRGYGHWEAILTCAGIPFVRVSPQVWKRKYGLIGKPKKASIAVARRLFPKTRIETDGEADAILIAAFLRSRYP